ncbi:MAG: radical SAM domain-containing protein [Actinomycetota bacterium]|nr:radical SAM domain-containing protein [Actinomycetota bacterium]
MRGTAIANNTPQTFALRASLRRGARWLRDLERRTSPAEPELLTALARRWEELPPGVQTPAQLLGRKLTGCEGTHGVFPACNFGCQPCYLSANSSRVRVDGAHTVAEVERQMAFFRERRGPAQYAQLIGGEVSLLPAEAHAEALEMMRRYGRMPMSFSHGDFDYEYLEEIAVRPDGSRRFDLVSFAIHIDSTMRGRRGIRHAGSERELHPERRRVREMFDRLTAEHGVRTHLAHNMTVTPDNLDEVADVVRVCRELGYRMCSFQPAAMVGDQRRWDEGYRTLTDDAVWAEAERGAGTRLPYKALQVGDLRCNRVTYGVWAADRYVPLLDDADPRDLRARDVFLARLPGNLLFAPPLIAAARVARGAVAASCRHPDRRLMGAALRAAPRRASRGWRFAPDHLRDAQLYGNRRCRPRPGTCCNEESAPQTRSS